MGMIQADIAEGSNGEPAFTRHLDLRSDNDIWERNGPVKRLMDVTISALAIVALLPVFIAAAIAIKITSRGPVLYRQDRLGRGGARFAMLKFRTMYDNADDLLAAVLKSCPLSAVEWETYQKLEYDPRITHVGNLLRRTSIDELPQLLNVLFGTMSIVGQRPILPDQQALYGAARFVDYIRARPGITGLWQVSGRNALPFERRAELDAEYTGNWSLAYDIKLLFKTIPAIIRPNGAF